MSSKKVKEFIKSIIIPVFNEQYGYSFDNTDFDVISIHTKTSRVAYELYTVKFKDFLRIRVYCDLGPFNTVNRFTLLDEINTTVGPSTKLFSTTGDLDIEFLYSNNNQIRQSFDWLTATESTYNIIIDEVTEEGILDELGDYILDESDTEVI